MGGIHKPDIIHEAEVPSSLGNDQADDQAPPPITKTVTWPYNQSILLFIATGLDRT